MNTHTHFPAPLLLALLLVMLSTGCENKRDDSRGVIAIGAAYVF